MALYVISIVSMHRVMAHAGTGNLTYIPQSHTCSIGV